ncbi:MAG TPA: hydroxyphenylacetyl-CoA thioesterase PaaI [Gemmatimonadaceae bacterium]|jgi:acyl-CoA thioesterase|nr:hydroxyphenylacetyl-CoA thioesterase PaaI [Gemmatimonadaceae bacterium]
MNGVPDDEQALAERVVSAMMAKDAFSRALGIEVVEVRPHAATVRLVVRDDMLNGFGLCHGGVPFSLADSALAFASNTHGRVTVSIENTITYPRKIVAGDSLVASAVEESSTNRLGFYRVTVHRNEEIVALFRGTVYKTSQAFFPDIE